MKAERSTKNSYLNVLNTRFINCVDKINLGMKHNKENTIQKFYKENNIEAEYQEYQSMKKEKELLETRISLFENKIRRIIGERYYDSESIFKYMKEQNLELQSLRELKEKVKEEIKLSVTVEELKIALERFPS
ncbi:MAG: hypothetical protein ABFC98_05775 [Candidatus Cloacimonas sp.]